MDYAASVTIGLSFFDEWRRIAPRWLSKDLIILFYKEENYAKSVNEFLEWYYMGHDSLNNQDKIKDLLNNDKLIHGRCGYLRQGFPLVFKDFEFNKINMHMDGVNGKLSDIDYYDTILTSVEKADFVADIGAPLYFKKNEYL